MKSTNLTNYREGLRDGIPIALGYLAVAFTLGIAARNLRYPCVSGYDHESGQTSLLQGNLPHSASSAPAHLTWK